MFLLLLFPILFPILVQSIELNFQTFEKTIVSKLGTDETHGVLVTGTPKLINNNLSVFEVNDDYLFRYLGMEEGSISLISLKDNLTNFNTWVSNETVVEEDGNIAFDVNAFLSNKESPQVPQQRNKMNNELNLYMDNELYKKHINVILFYRDNFEAKTLANIIHKQPQHPNITYNCWDVLRSDPPVFIDTIPSIGITSEILEQRIPILRPPVNDQTLQLFIEANLKEIAIKEPHNKT